MLLTLQVLVIFFGFPFMLSKVLPTSMTQKHRTRNNVTYMVFIVLISVTSALTWTQPSIIIEMKLLPK